MDHRYDIINMFEKLDLFPMNDKFLQVRMKRLYGANCNISDISARWEPYRSVVTWYLWRWF
jgi:3-methyladenine DNA glycosylase/8-oxoguanine DNA glycosylase